MKRRFLAMMMAVVMCFSLVTVVAAEGEELPPIMFDYVPEGDGRIKFRLEEPGYRPVTNETLCKYKPYYVITDEDGKTIQKRHFSDSKYVSVAPGVSGMYYLSVFDSDGNRLGTNTSHGVYTDPLAFTGIDAPAKDTDDKFHSVLDVSRLISDVHGEDDPTVDVWYWFTRADDPDLPIDDDFLKANNLTVKVWNYGWQVVNTFSVTGDSMHFTLTGPGRFRIDVEDGDGCNQDCFAHDYYIYVATEGYEPDSELTDRWAQTLIEKSSGFNPVAADRDEYMMSILNGFAEELGTDVQYLFDINLMDALIKVYDSTGDDFSKNSIAYAIDAQWELAEKAVQEYVAELAKYTFTDVPDDIWYAPYVKSAARSGLVKGKSEGVFAPDASMTIAEAITLAARFEAALYEDIDPAEGKIGKRWYYPYIWYARERGIPCDYEDYNAKITREEFAHIFATLYKNHKNLYDEAGIVALNDVPDGFIPDVAKDDDFADDIYTLYRLGVLSGSDSKRSFLPDSNIKRSEVAAILCRLGGTGRVEF